MSNNAIVWKNKYQLKEKVRVKSNVQLNFQEDLNEVEWNNCV